MSINRKSFAAKTNICFVLAAIFLANGNCGEQKMERMKVVGIRLLSRLPIVSDQGSLDYMLDSVMLYSHDKVNIYKIPVPITDVKIFTDSSGNIRNEQQQILGVKYEYFVYHQDSSIGVAYDTLLIGKGRPRLVDSFLYRKTLTSFEQFYKAITQNLSLVTSKEFHDGNLLEIYIPKIKKDISYADTIFLSYSKKLSDIDYFSFSKQADSSKKGKLYKVSLIYNSNPSHPDVFGQSAKQFTFEFQRLGDQIPSDIDLFLHGDGVKNKKSN